MHKLASIIICTLLLGFLCTLSSHAQAAYDPLSVPNNKYGIHLISPNAAESEAARDLVNYNGDWGYVTVVIESDDRDVEKWQSFFNKLRRDHLIPLVRIATEVQGEAWRRPSEDEAWAWAEFLDNLVWPINNRYVIVYNEPNHALEWGGEVDAASYARNLSMVADALKARNKDFFVLNAGFDASAPEKLPAYGDQEKFMKEMEQEVPGIFKKLDGWVSHSYPNPDFSGVPTASGRGTVQTYQWELDLLEKYGVQRDLPVFITETGWKHAEGPTPNFNYLNANTVAEHYKTAFEKIWNNPQIIAITPFVLDYQSELFEHFSFKKPDTSVAKASDEQFYPQYQVIKDLPKTAAKPPQKNSAEIVDSNLYDTVALDETYHFSVKVKNNGQSIWGERGPVRLISQGVEKLGITEGRLPEDVRVEPGQEYTFNLTTTPKELGDFRGSLVMVNGDGNFSSEPFYFSTTVKSAVLLKIKAKLAWKDDGAGNYILSWIDGIHEVAQKVVLNDKNESESVPGHTIFPDMGYNFTLSKPFYKSKTIYQTVRAGENTIDFGELQPDLPSAILNPPEFLKLLP